MFAPKYPDATIAISSRVCSCFFFFFFLTNKLSYFPMKASQMSAVFSDLKHAGYPVISLE